MYTIPFFGGPPQFHSNATPAAPRNVRLPHCKVRILDTDVPQIWREPPILPSHGAGQMMQQTM